MNRIIVQGGKRLHGQIRVQGAKNEVLKVIAASIFFDEKIQITNVPEIADIFHLLEIIEDLGGQWVHKKEHVYAVETKNLKKTNLSKSLTSKLRAAIVLLGPLLARFGKASLPHPGGCAIGRRPIDIFIKGLQAMGTRVRYANETYYFQTAQLRSVKFVFPIISVTATETLLLAACLTPGQTVLINAAQEPEISALAAWLNSCGAKIKGAGTSKIIIEGVKKLKAKDVEIIPDRIEAGSFVILAAATQSYLKITHCQPEHLSVFLEILKEMGLPMKIGQNWIEVFPAGRLRAHHIVTHEYPGLATDLQPPMTVLLTQCQGQSLVRETIYEGRLFYVDMLNRMAANILMCDPSRILVTGPTPLRAKPLESPDLRAGIAMVIAALVARGTSEIANAYQIERGYENIINRLKKIGAHVKAG